MFKKYNVYVPYTLWVVKEIEAEDEGDAIDEAFNNNMINEYLPLCYNCMKNKNIVNYPSVNIDLAYAIVQKDKNDNK